MMGLMSGAEFGRAFFGCTGEYLFPVFPDASLSIWDAPAWRLLRLARVSMAGGDPRAGAALLRQLDAETEAGPRDPDGEALRDAARLEAGVLAWRAGEREAAAEHFRAATGSARRTLRDRALLNLACCDTDPDWAALAGSSVAPEAALARAAALGSSRDLAACHRALGALATHELPERARAYALVNEGVVLTEIGHYDAAGACFTRADPLLAPGPDHARATLLINWGSCLVLDAAARSGAERARRWAHAETLLVEASNLLERWTAPAVLAADCLRNLGVLHLAGAREAHASGAASTSVTGRLTLALRSHWEALVAYEGASHVPAGRVGDQFRNLALCYDLADRLGTPGASTAAALATSLRGEARERLAASGDHAALVEADLIEAARLLDDDPGAAADLAVPAALYRNAQRHGLVGADLRDRWSRAEAADALDLALVAAERAGRGDLAAALVVARRFGGVGDWDTGEEPVWGATVAEDRSSQLPPPSIAGTTDLLEPFRRRAAERYRVPLDRLRTPVVLDLGGSPDQ